MSQSNSTAVMNTLRSKRLQLILTAKQLAPTTLSVYFSTAIDVLLVWFMKYFHT